MNSQTPSDFRKAFEEARERTVAALVEAVSGAPNVLCGPLDPTGMFGWQFEGTDPEHSSASHGDLSYGTAYLRQMINQGFRVGFAAWREPDRVLVCLKAWEGDDEDEPDWPRDTKGAVVVYHRSISRGSES